MMNVQKLPPKKLTDQRHIAALTWLCATAYLVSYLTRKNFSAVTAEFVVAENVTKTAASYISVALFVCYGIGQLVSGWLGDHVSPRFLIFGGLFSASVCNLVVPLVGSNISVLIIVWGINGFAQAMMWPPMIKLATNRLTDATYKRTCVRISWGSSFGTIAIYLIAALFIRVFSDWRMVFVFSAMIGVAFSIVWLICSARLESYAEQHGEVILEDGENGSTLSHQHETISIRYLFVGSPIIVMMIAIILQGMLRDGIETWMPSYLHDVFGLETSNSILISVGLPIFTVVTFQIMAMLYRKWFRNELVWSTVLFGVAGIASTVLCIFYQTNVALSSALVILLVGAVHGVNMMLISYAPSAFRKYGKVSLVSGMLNSCTYVGSALFTYGVAKLADLFNWQMTILGWIIVALLGLLLCAVVIRSWIRFTANSSVNFTKHERKLCRAERLQSNGHNHGKQT